MLVGTFTAFYYRRYEVSTRLIFIIMRRTVINVLGDTVEKSKNYASGITIKSKCRSNSGIPNLNWTLQLIEKCRELRDN